MNSPKSENKKSAPDDLLISVRNVSKKYSLGLRSALWYGVKDIAAEFFIAGSAKRDVLRSGEFWALRDISFDLKRGESLAIIGANGAGKTTLLRLLYGLIRPDAGEIVVNGKLGAMIELSAGLDPVLTGRENIFIKAALLGLGKEETEPLVEAIVEFAELGDFLDTPIQYYSTGMVSRLSYSVTAFMKPEVMLVDEILAVGDITFQRKCINHMIEYVSLGGSIILVTHNYAHIHSICERGILVELGQLLFSGDTIATFDFYLQRQNERTKLSTRKKQDSKRNNDSPVKINSVTVEPLTGHEIKMNSDVRLKVAYSSSENFEDVTWGFQIWTIDNGTFVAGASPAPIIMGAGDGELSCVIPKIPLMARKYLLKVGIADTKSIQPLATWGWQNNPTEFEVRSKPNIVRNLFAAEDQLVTIEVEWD